MYMGKKNGNPIIDTSKYGVCYPVQEPDYKFPRGHPCCGCPFISGSFQILLPPCRDRASCQYAFLERLQNRKPPKYTAEQQRIHDYIRVLEAVKQRKERRKKAYAESS